MNLNAIEWGKRVFPYGLITILALMNLVLLSEQDVFWQIRAGEEVFLNKTVSGTDSWSSTAFGESWWNFQWLFSLLLFLFYNATGSYDYFPILRSLLVFALFHLLFIQFRNLVPKQPKLVSLICLLVLPLVYMISWGPIELRADFVTNILFVGLLSIHLNDESTERQKIVFSFLLLLFWANIHAGTVPIGILFACANLAVGKYQSIRLPLKVALMTLFVSTWVLTPIGYHSIEAVIRYVRYDSTIIHNADQKPLLLKHFGFNLGTIPNYLMFSFLIGTVVLYLRNFATFKDQLPKIFHSRLFVILFATIIFMLATQKYRNFRYLILFFAPLAAVILQYYLAKLRQREIGILWIVGALFATFLVSYRYKMDQPVFGLGVDDVASPVRIVEFLKNTKPHGKLFNNYNFGGYLIQELREYPVSSDGRELIYETYLREQFSAGKSPEEMGGFLKKYQFDLVIAQLEPKTKSNLPRLLSLLPKNDWALVHIDKGALLFARRNPTNDGFISKNETSVSY